MRGKTLEKKSAVFTPQVVTRWRRVPGLKRGFARGQRWTEAAFSIPAAKLALGTPFMVEVDPSDAHSTREPGALFGGLKKAKLRITGTVARTAISAGRGVESEAVPEIIRGDSSQFLSEAVDLR
jgi:hypothetical protein